MKSLLVCATLLCCTIGFAFGGTQIPFEPEGWVYKGGKGDADVLMELYIEPVCGDSKKAFPVLKTIAEDYGVEKVQLKIRQYPLAYHRYAHMGCQVCL